ncbi:DinB family protein [Cytophagaceae bacterium ABcell3]|nr:DinB family protein [Cytophagaceae bacterium ABcell3]
MEEFFKNLLEYNSRCNQALAQKLQKAPPSKKALQLYCHIINSHEIWNCRIRGEQIVTRDWDIRKNENLCLIDSVNLQYSLKVVLEHDLSSTIWYSSIKGEKYARSIKEILFHIINHSTYHRAQIATDFRQNNKEPVMTDFIIH